MKFMAYLREIQRQLTSVVLQQYSAFNGSNTGQGAVSGVVKAFGAIGVGVRVLEDTNSEL